MADSLQRCEKEKQALRSGDNVTLEAVKCNSKMLMVAVTEKSLLPEITRGAVLEYLSFTGKRTINHSQSNCFFPSGKNTHPLLK